MFPFIFVSCCVVAHQHSYQILDRVFGAFDVIFFFSVFVLTPALFCNDSCQRNSKFLFDERMACLNLVTELWYVCTVHILQSCLWITGLKHLIHTQVILFIYLFYLNQTTFSDILVEPVRVSVSPWKCKYIQWMLIILDCTELSKLSLPPHGWLM